MSSRLDERWGSSIVVVECRLTNLLSGEAARPSRHTLLAAFHYPLWASSTGYLRTLGGCGESTECTVRGPRISDLCTGYRAPLGCTGKYLSLLAIHDRSIFFWWPDVMWVDLKLNRQRKIDGIWSTYPIMTSRLIVLTLSHISNLPGVADLLDSVIATDGRLRERAWRWLERKGVERSAHSAFKTEGARCFYKTRFSKDLLPRTSVIANGFDEAFFSQLTPPLKNPTVRLPWHTVGCFTVMAVA